MAKPVDKFSVCVKCGVRRKILMGLASVRIALKTLADSGCTSDLICALFSSGRAE